MFQTLLEVRSLVLNGFAAKEVLDAVLPLHHTEKADELADERFIAARMDNSLLHCMIVACPIGKRLRMSGRLRGSQRL